MLLNIENFKNISDMIHPVDSGFPGCCGQKGEL